MFSQFARELKCLYCGQPNPATQWRALGDLQPFYCQAEPGRYNLTMTCPHCQRVWYVAWDDDPGPLASPVFPGETGPAADVPEGSGSAQDNTDPTGTAESSCSSDVPQFGQDDFEAETLEQLFCPNCRTIMNAEAILCINCGYNRSTGELLAGSTLASEPAPTEQGVNKANSDGKNGPPADGDIYALAEPKPASDSEFTERSQAPLDALEQEETNVLDRSSDKKRDSVVEGRFEEESGYSVAAEDRPVLCVCRNCETRYVLGHNAVVTTMEDAWRELQIIGSGFSIGTPSFREPDLVALVFGEKSWPEGTPLPLTEGRPIAAAIKESRDRQETRMWRCSKCSEAQEYQWFTPAIADTAGPATQKSREENRMAPGSGKKRFCPYCGQALLAKESTCSVCSTGGPDKPFWHFPKCAGCGEQLAIGRVICRRCNRDHALDSRPSRRVFPQESLQTSPADRTEGQPAAVEGAPEDKTDSLGQETDPKQPGRVSACCPHCQRRFSARQEAIGKTVKCPVCGKRFCFGTGQHEKSHRWREASESDHPRASGSESAEGKATAVKADQGPHEGHCKCPSCGSRVFIAKGKACPTCGRTADLDAEEIANSVPEEYPLSEPIERMSFECARNASRVTNMSDEKKGTFSGKCPHCQKKVSVAFEHAGKMFKCPTCSKAFRIGSPPESAKVTGVTDSNRSVPAQESAAETPFQIETTLQRSKGTKTPWSHIVSCFMGSKEHRLIKATAKGSTERARRLLAEGAKPDTRDAEGLTPLIATAEQGNDALARLLLGAGADVNAHDTGGRTPLIAAAEQGSSVMARMFVELGADINARDAEGRTPLIAVAQGAPWAVYRRMKQRGATPPDSATKQDREALAQYLLGAGADVNASDLEGSTPLISAANKGNDAMVGQLLKAGADVNARDKKEYTAIMRALEGSGGEPADRRATAHLLLEAGADIGEGEGSHCFFESRLKKLWEVERYLAEPAAQCAFCKQGIVFPVLVEFSWDNVRWVCRKCKAPFERAVRDLARKISGI